MSTQDFNGRLIVSDMEFDITLTKVRQQRALARAERQITRLTPKGSSVMKGEVFGVVPYKHRQKGFRGSPVENLPRGKKPWNKPRSVKQAMQRYFSA